MKRVGLITLVALIFIGFSVPKADALPAFSKAWQAKYVKTNKNKKFAAVAKKAKCNVCHFGRSKKNRNDYGRALSKAGLTKKVHKKLKKDKPKLSKIILTAFEKVAKTKNAEKKTFGSLIKAGMLPGKTPKKKKKK